MIVKATRTYLPQTLDAARVLGLEVAAARRRRRMTVKDLAERAGITAVTVRKAERGDPTVALGTMFEVAGLVGVDLFGAGPAELPALVRRSDDRLALLPARVRATDEGLNNDF
ncbi:MAG: helix-turn-helix transcriptional regulator [Actinomycetota bacterium]|nr:helix-turn-helix transcriptional regulator [Actinomycetota bacterium]